MKRDTALALARQGFKVFPITSGAKAPPLILGWQIAATSDEAQVRDWWAKWPDANIGVHCDGLIVLDVDVGKGGYDSLKKLQDERGELPATLTVSTPSGGEHRYFKGSNVPNGVNVYGPGIDVRSGGGYVLASGSVVDGKSYAVRTPAVPAPAPEWLKERHVEQKPSQREHAPIATDQATAKQSAVAYLEHLDAAVSGARNHAAYVTAAKLRDIGCGQAVTLEVMQAHWKCEPPLDDAELRHVVQSAFTYAQNPPAILSAEAMFDVLPDEAKAPRAPSMLHHPSEAELSDALRPQYLIKGVIDAKSNAVLFGKWHTGKSFVALDLCAVIATGSPWFGRRTRGGGVLYIAYEGIRALTKRLIALRNKYPALADTNTPFAWTAARHTILDGKGTEEFATVLETYKDIYGAPPALVVIDPLMNALGGDDSDAAVMSKMNEFVATVIQKQGATVLRVHHTGHSNQDRARGHSSLEASADTELKVDDGEIYIKKQRDDAGGTFPFELKVVTLGADSDGDPVTTCVVEPRAAGDVDLSDQQQQVYSAALELRKADGTIVRSQVKLNCPLENNEFASAWNALKRRRLITQVGRKYKVDSDSAAAAIATPSIFD